MKNAKYYSTGDFAVLSNSTRATLHHYDRIGLLSPQRGENNYRYYTARQLPIMHLISTLQEFGMSLEDIKILKDSRTPESVSEMLLKQIDAVDANISKWVQAKKLLNTMHETIMSATGGEVKENAVTIQFLPAEAIILGNINDYSRGKTDYEAMHSFYEYMQKTHKDLNLNYPVWAMFTQERIKQGDWKWPERYYFYNPEGYDKRPAGLYAIGYTRGDYGQTDDLYKKLIRYIDENGFEIFGNTYEEYPLNELCVTNPARYLIRVMIAVREKP